MIVMPMSLLTTNYLYHAFNISSLKSQLHNIYMPMYTLRVLGGSPAELNMLLMTLAVTQV